MSYTIIRRVRERSRVTSNAADGMSQFSDEIITQAITDAQAEIDLTLAGYYTLPFVTDTDIAPDGTEADLAALIEAGTLPSQIEYIARLLASALVLQRVRTAYAGEAGSNSWAHDEERARDMLTSLTKTRPTIGSHAPISALSTVQVGDLKTISQRVDELDTSAEVEESVTKWPGD